MPKLAILFTIFGLFSKAYAGELLLKPLSLGDLTQPVQATVSPSEGALYIVEQVGRIVKVENSTRSIFLDIRKQVVTGGERGLLGLAFHPQFPILPRFFLNYTAHRNGQLHTIVEKYEIVNGKPVAKGEVIRIFQPFANHNGGQIAFGPDGMLYIGMGDGGSAGDPQGHAQNLKSLLGKMLRIDVDSKEPYAIPADNPFVGTSARGEIFAYGLRNPWRFSFDAETGDLITGDVGQGKLEEVDIIRAGGNYGWKIMEGKACFEPQVGCEKKGLELPIYEYGRAEGFSITGGFVYHGTGIARLVGAYLFGDFGSGKIWALRRAADGTYQSELLMDSGLSISAFGESVDGEILVVDHSGSVLEMIEKMN